MASEAPTRVGMNRRELIRNAGILGAAAWTAPMILQSGAAAGTQCSPIPCVDHYSAKWDGNPNCSGGVLAGGSCGPLPGPNDTDQCPGIVPVPTPLEGCTGTNGATLACVGTSLQVVLNNPSSCRFVKVWYKKGEPCTVAPTTGCESSVTIDEATPSHVSAVWCCS